MFDLNTAEAAAPRETLIPHGTIVPVHMTVRPGGAGENGWLKRSAKGALMIDAEFTVLEGEFAKRKFWSYFVLDGETDGQKSAGAISRSNIRAIVESAKGIKPSDADERAVAGRRLNGYEDLDGLRFWCAVKLEKGQDGYKDKNQFSYAVTPDRKEWRQLEQMAGGGGKPAQAGGSPVAKASSGRPSWAGSSSGNKTAGAVSPELDDAIPY